MSKDTYYTRIRPGEKGKGMKFTITFQIYPEGVFGVPEEGGTVLPARPGSSAARHRSLMEYLG